VHDLVSRHGREVDRRDPADRDGARRRGRSTPLALTLCRSTWRDAHSGEIRWSEPYENDLSDPFAEKPSPWPKILIAVVILWIAYALLNRMGFIHDWTNGRLGSPRPAVEQKATGDAKPGEPAPADAAK
jgi:hypothetical protein